jgi:ATP-dependent helicase HrpB
MSRPEDLPIHEITDSLIDGVRTHGRVVVSAPTGSGKSTQVPKMLRASGLLGDGQVVILQPRRIAARMLARRVAEELGVKVGAEVGYQVRLDSQVSNKTRIRYVTEGILLRQMTFEPELKGVGALIFDEFHERHLDGDIGLARALQIQQTTRPDLKILVMSATLDASMVADYLAPAAVIRSEGRMFPVEIEYQPKAVDPDKEEIWDAAARVTSEAVGRTESGDVLVFMPGSYEIARTIDALRHEVACEGCIILPLHGELSPQDQDAAVARHGRRKIIVSTNVAETSLTIDGVTAVVDSGLARIARFDPHRGINTLLIEKISAASADQRAGRAGRTAPGVCLRMWTERDHATRAPSEMPEVKRLDLAEVVLTLKAAGIEDVVNFPWIERPDPKALQRAETLLLDLGAIEWWAGFTPGDSGIKPDPQRKILNRITEMGRRMLKFPVHPRYARMFLEADARRCVRAAAFMASLTQGRGFLLRNPSKSVAQAREDTLGQETESDFFLLMRAWRYADRANYSVDACRRLGIHAQSARQVAPMFFQFLEIAKDEGLDIAEHRVDGAEIRKCVLSGFVDQLAHRLDTATQRCELVHGRKGMLARESAIQDAPLFVAGDISEIGGRAGEVTTVLGLATAIEESWLRELFPKDFNETTGVQLDPTTRRVVAKREKRFRDLVLESKEGAEPPEGKAAAILAKEVIAGNIVIKEWTEAVEQWITRVNRFAEWFPEYEAHPIGEADRALLIEQICYGAYSAKEVKDRPVWEILKDWLTPEQLAAMETVLPERLDMPNGRKSRLTYHKEGPPVIAARIQELFGISKNITLGRGRVPVKIEVLAPNQRPIQVTDDLERFWRETYPEIKPALSRRYPRHEWR